MRQILQQLTQHRVQHNNKTFSSLPIVVPLVPRVVASSLHARIWQLVGLYAASTAGLLFLASIGTLAWAPPKTLGNMPVSALFAMVLVTAITIGLYNLASLVDGNIVKGTIYQAAGADMRE